MRVSGSAKNLTPNPFPSGKGDRFRKSEKGPDHRNDEETGKVRF
jgi:hypothetical protein